MPETLEAKLAKIERGEQQILRMFQEYMQPGSDMYLSDFLMVGVVKRTVSLADGFRTLTTARNFTCAAALVRMQLDTAFRLYAATLTHSPEKYAHEVFHGKPIDKMKDRDGNRMTDGHLARKLNEQYPWILNVYKETSELVHFTSRHIFASATKLDDETRTVHFMVSAKDPPRPDQDYFEVVDCFYTPFDMAFAQPANLRRCPPRT
jgi:hypothetical protein